MVVRRRTIKESLSFLSSLCLLLNSYFLLPTSFSLDPVSFTPFGLPLLSSSAHPTSHLSTTASSHTPYSCPALSCPSPLARSTQEGTFAPGIAAMTDLPAAG